ncbi:MAG: outer membrane protein assembly factor BamE [Burkholderiales bacterium]
MVCPSSPLLRRRCALICVLLAAGLAGCSSQTVENVLEDIPGIAPYRIEIQQGNYVSQDMIDKLKRGMSREQVRFVLGTPLLTDMFHANRWDYVFFRERPNKTREERRISVFFENNRLVRVDGNVKPEAQSGAKAVESQREAANAQGDEAPNAEAVKPEASEPQAPAAQDRQ